MFSLSSTHLSGPDEAFSHLFFIPFASIGPVDHPLALSLGVNELSPLANPFFLHLLVVSVHFAKAFIVFQLLKLPRTDSVSSSVQNLPRSCASLVFTAAPHTSGDCGLGSEESSWEG